MQTIRKFQKGWDSRQLDQAEENLNSYLNWLYQQLMSVSISMAASHAHGAPQQRVFQWVANPSYWTHVISGGLYLPGDISTVLEQVAKVLCEYESVSAVRVGTFACTRWQIWVGRSFFFLTHDFGSNVISITPD